MSNEFLLLLLAIFVGFGVLAFFIRKWIVESNQNQKPDQLLGDLIKSFDARSGQFNERLDNAARVIAQVQKNIGEFSEIGRSMKDLQNFLRSPKLRGTIGEEVLADLIGQMFPKHTFFLQYAFKSGARVDAAIKTDAGILCIDAKFPMENYQKMAGAETDADRELYKKELIRDIKRHIDAISSKYILPEEGTLDFALMYIPAESVFYELVQISEVMTFAKRARVYPVSPTTLYAHLQTILLSFAGKQLEVKTQEVFKLLRGMVTDYEKVTNSVAVMGKHVTNAYNQMNVVNQNIHQLGQKLSSTQHLETETEQQSLLDS